MWKKFKKGVFFFKDYGAWFLLLLILPFFVRDMIPDGLISDDVAQVEDAAEPAADDHSTIEPPTDVPNPMERKPANADRAPAARRLPKRTTPAKPFHRAPVRTTVKKATSVQARPASQVYRGTASPARPVPQQRISPTTRVYPDNSAPAFRPAPPRSPSGWQYPYRAPRSSPGAPYPSLQVPGSHSYSAPAGSLPALKKGPPIAPNPRRSGRVIKLDMTPKYR